MGNILGRTVSAYALLQPANVNWNPTTSLGSQ